MEKRTQLTTAVIEVITALADEGSFTLAADRLGITQSAVSRTVNQIENALGVVLFKRSRTGATPTAALAAALPRLRRIQRELDGVTEALTAADQGLSGKISVAGFRSAVVLLLPPAVSTFMTDHPDVRVSLAAVREQGLGVQQVVEAGEADFGVTSFKPSKRLRSTYLGSDPYVLVRRAKMGKFSPTDEQLVLWKERCSEIVPSIIDRQGWSVPTRMEVDSDSAVLAMVSHGAGFTIMPELAAEPLPEGLEKVPLSGDFRRDVWLCGLPAAWESRTGRTLVSYIKKAARPLLNGSLLTK